MGKKIAAPEIAEKFPLEVVNEFFPPPGVKQERSFPSLIKIGQALKGQGIAQSQLREALAVILGIMSTKWGDPVPIVITEDEGAGVVEFLDTCLSVVPEECWVDEATLNKKAGTNGAAQGKTVVAYDADSANATLSTLLMNSERPQTSKSKKGQIGSTLASSFVAISKNQDSPLFRSRYVVRVHLRADGDSKNERIKRLANQAGVDVDNRMKVEGACIKTLLRRIKPQAVNILFADKIINKQALGIQNVVPIYDIVLRIIRNIARINNPPPLHPIEQLSAFLGLDFEDFIERDIQHSTFPVVATKVDYSCFLETFSYLFNAVSDLMTPRQLIIYNTIYRHNIENLTSTTVKRLDEEARINYMHENDLIDAWATREQLYKKIIAETGEEISISTLNRELQELVARDLVKKSKKSKRKYLYAYAVYQLINNAPMFERDLAQIHDPVYKESPVEVKGLISSQPNKNEKAQTS